MSGETRKICDERLHLFDKYVRGGVGGGAVESLLSGTNDWCGRRRTNGHVVSVQDAHGNGNGRTVSTVNKRYYLQALSATLKGRRKQRESREDNGPVRHSGRA